MSNIFVVERVVLEHLGHREEVTEKELLSAYSSHERAIDWISDRVALRLKHTALFEDSYPFESGVIVEYKNNTREVYSVVEVPMVA